MTSKKQFPDGRKPLAAVTPSQPSDTPSPLAADAAGSASFPTAAELMDHIHELCRRAGLNKLRTDAAMQAARVMVCDLGYSYDRVANIARRFIRAWSKMDNSDQAFQARKPAFVRAVNNWVKKA